MAHEASDLSDRIWELWCITSYTEMNCVTVQKLNQTACKRHEGILLLYLTSAGPQVQCCAPAAPLKRAVD